MTQGSLVNQTKILIKIESFAAGMLYKCYSN